MRIGTKSVIVKDGKVLLIRRSNYDTHMAGKWDLPGGRLEPGERIFDGHKREVMEETKLIIEILEPVRCWSAERLGEKHAGVTLLSKHMEGSVILSNEHTEFKWVSPEEMQKTDAAEWIKDEVKLAQEINPELFHSRQKL